jgi:hypothetical protein
MYMTYKANGILFDDLYQAKITSPFDLDEWVSDFAYPKNAIAKVGNAFYISTDLNNLGNVPTDLPGENSFWSLFRFLTLYNSTTSYAIGQTTFTANGKMWASISNSNIDNDPLLDIHNTYWEPAAGENLRYRKAVFTATEGQTDFYPNANFSSIHLLFVEGISQIDDESYELVQMGNETIIRTLPLSAGQRVLAVIGQEIQYIEPEQVDFRYVRYPFFPATPTTQFVLPVNVKQILYVIVNGLHQTPVNAYEFDVNTQTVTLASGTDKDVLIYAGDEPPIEGDAGGQIVAAEGGTKTDTLAGWTQDIVNLNSIQPMALGTIVTTGIVLIEAQSLKGTLAAIPATGEGTIFEYSGASNAITINGEWTGFDSRRFNKLSDFSINITGSAVAALYADFMTIFEINNVISYGSADYHFYLKNSYNGKISGGRLKGATVANMIMTISATASVFSGQTLIENLDFWDAHNVDNDAGGLILESPSNIMEQVLLTKCHWKGNDIGLWVKSGGDKTLISAHFETSSQNDLRVDSGADNPKILSAFVNNGLTTTESFLLDGKGGCVKQTDFIRINNGAACIKAGPNSLGLVIENVSMVRNSGNTMNGILVEGEDTTIRNVIAETGGSAATWPAITIAATAKNTKISSLSLVNFGGVGAVVDNGGENTIFEDAITIESPVWDVNGGVQETAFYVNQSGYINRAWIVYVAGTGAGTATSFQLGRSTSPGTSDYTRYFNHSTAVSALAHSKEIIAIGASPFLSKSDVLLLRTNGSSTTVGNAKLIVEITPYRALT